MGLELRAGLADRRSSVSRSHTGLRLRVEGRVQLCRGGGAHWSGRQQSEAPYLFVRCCTSGSSKGTFYKLGLRGEFPVPRPQPRSPKPGPEKQGLACHSQKPSRTNAGRFRMSPETPTSPPLPDSYMTRWESSPGTLRRAFEPFPSSTASGWWWEVRLGQLPLIHHYCQGNRSHPLGQSCSAPAPLAHLGLILRPSYEQSFDLLE